DFLVVDSAGAFLLDTSREKAGELAKRLGLYKLRAKVEIADLSAEARGDDGLALVALLDGAAAPDGAVAFDDPRAADLGRRAITPLRLARAIGGDPRLYEARRIAAGAPRGGADFTWGDAFPHEANMDLLHGVAFDKGCYVGQEVVSRMQHRGLARKRVVKVAIEGAVAPGVQIRAGDISIGALGDIVEGRGLATVRTDRLEEAGDTPLIAGGAQVRVI
ncbi:MAG: folate-binding protein YgfZ, partial [Hyphomicrobiales bacterium]|nr:folate-binding protein YgfZ [Hyphomicrobiales bacterium]